MCFIILISVIRININTNSKYKITDESFVGNINQFTIDGNKLTFIIKSKEKIKGIYYIKTEEEKEYLQENIKIGIRITLKGKLAIPSKNTIKNTFNYNNYLKRNGINYILNVDEYKISNFKINIFYKIKNIIYSYIVKFKSKDYLLTFLMGNKTLLDENIYQKYQKLGVSHLFAISGMHISFFVLIIFKLLKNIKDNQKYIITILLLLIYMFFTSYQPSVMRSSFMFVLLYINKKFDLNITTISLLYLDISLILLINYNLLVNIGFIYSSVISYALIKYSKYITGNYFLKLIKISLIAFLFSIPITINTNYELNIISIIYNLIYVPLVSYIIFPLSLLTLIIKPLDIILLNILTLLETITLQLPTIIITVKKLPVIVIIIYYMFLTMFMNSFNIKYVLMFIFALAIPILYNIFDKNLYITYIDVGQGDSILISYKNKVYLLDTGGKVVNSNENWKATKTYNVSDTYINYFKSIGVTKIDGLILTHGDYDHMGEAINLVENFKVENVIFNCGEYNDLEKKLISVLENKNINYYSCIKELNIDKYKLQFLNTGVYDNENDNSSVIYLNYNNYKFLFMGDASTIREKDILEKYNLSNIDFLKVGHHGSNTSSSEDFINSINPKYSLISVGKNNRYGHPKESVLDILENTKIYRTDLDGSIEIKLNKSGYKIRTCPP